jgi:hypothetical protein
METMGYVKTAEPVTDLAVEMRTKIMDPTEQVCVCSVLKVVFQVSIYNRHTFDNLRATKK